jgi:hypothetical protein
LACRRLRRARELFAQVDRVDSEIVSESGSEIMSESGSEIVSESGSEIVSESGSDLVGTFACPDSGRSAQPVAKLAQRWKIEAIIWAFSQRDELGAASWDR